MDNNTPPQYALWLKLNSLQKYYFHVFSTVRVSIRHLHFETRLSIPWFCGIPRIGFIPRPFGSILFHTKTSHSLFRNISFSAHQLLSPHQSCSGHQSFSAHQSFSSLHSDFAGSLPPQSFSHVPPIRAVCWRASAFSASRCLVRILRTGIRKGFPENRERGGSLLLQLRDAIDRDWGVEMGYCFTACI